MPGLLAVSRSSRDQIVISFLLKKSSSCNRIKGDRTTLATAGTVARSTSALVKKDVAPEPEVHEPMRHASDLLMLSGRQHPRLLKRDADGAALECML